MIFSEMGLGRELRFFFFILCSSQKHFIYPLELFSFFAIYCGDPFFQTPGRGEGVNIQ